MSRPRQAQLVLVTLLLTACQTAVPADTVPPRALSTTTPDGVATTSPDGTASPDGVATTSPDRSLSSGGSVGSGPASTSPTGSVRGSPGPSPARPPATSSSAGPGGSAPSANPSLTAGGCPDARTCGHYALLAGRWPQDPDGGVTLRYRIRTEGYLGADGNFDPDDGSYDPDMAAAPGPEEMIAMIRAAAQTWMNANPKIRLVYDGTTPDLPANGNNVIGWGNGIGANVASASHTPSEGTYTGFEVIFESTKWSWDSCDPDAGQPCTDNRWGGGDFQAVATHEWGHVLVLDHTCPAGCAEEDVEQTMDPGLGRSAQTLAFGDILGVRHLYPTDAAMPTIHRP